MHNNLKSGKMYLLLREMQLLIFLRMERYPDRIFRASALWLVDALVSAVVAATLLVIVALFFIPGPPQLFELVVAAVPVGATIALVLLVMRSLLRSAVAMHVELDEVV